MRIVVVYGVGVGGMVGRDRYRRRTTTMTTTTKQPGHWPPPSVTANCTRRWYLVSLWITRRRHLRRIPTFGPYPTMNRSKPLRPTPSTPWAGPNFSRRGGVRRQRRSPSWIGRPCWCQDIRKGPVMPRILRRTNRSWPRCCYRDRKNGSPPGGGGGQNQLNNVRRSVERYFPSTKNVVTHPKTTMQPRQSHGRIVGRRRRRCAHRNYITPLQQNNNSDNDDTGR